MHNLHIEKSSTTPFVHFDYAAGKLEIAGRSISEKSVDFYKPLQDWVACYCKKPNSTTTLELKLEYLNTYSSKCLVDIFKLLEEINEKDAALIVLWYVEKADNEMKQLGKDYQSIIDLPLDIVEVDEIQMIL